MGDDHIDTKQKGFGEIFTITATDADKLLITFENPFQSPPLNWK